MSVKLRKKKLAGGKVSLYLDLYRSGKRQYEFLNLYLEPRDKAHNKETLQLAESIRAKRQLESQNSEHGFVPKFKRQANFVEYFELLCQTKPKGEKAWWNTLKHLQTFTKGRIAFSAIDERWLEDFKAYLVEQLSPNTAHTYFSKIKASLNQAIKDKIILANPSQSVSQVKKQETQRTFLTVQELKALADTPCQNEEIKRAFLFSCCSGLRLSDVSNLKWGNIKEGTLEFRQQKTKGVEYLPLSPTAIKLLNIVTGNNLDLVFHLPSRQQITKVLKRWAKIAGLEKHVSFHTARHTFATLGLTSGVDLYTISKLLGHRNIAATQIYAKVIDEKKRQAVNMFPELELN